MKKVLIAMLIILNIFMIGWIVIFTVQPTEEEVIATETDIEEPFEETKIQSALVDAVVCGEDATLNMDCDLVMRILTAEMGDNENYEGVWAIATMMRNGWTTEHSLMQNIKDGWYTDPADYIGEKARVAFYEVFIFNNLCPQVEDATFFYSTRNGFWSQGHETRHEFVCEITNYDGSTIRCFR